MGDGRVIGHSAAGVPTVRHNRMGGSVRTSSRLLRLVLIVSMLSAMLAGGELSANATTTPAPNLGCTAIAPNAKPSHTDTKAIGTYHIKMRQQHASQGTIDAGLKACFGLVRKTGSTVIGVRPNDSNRNDLTFDGPSVYWDEFANDNVVEADWTFNTLADMDDGDHSDGFALGASAPIRVASMFGAWYGDVYTEKTTTVSDGGGDLGRGFDYDNYYNSLVQSNDSYGKHGSLTIAFDRNGLGCGNVYFTPHYSHGWSGATLTNITISLSPSGPSVSAVYTNTSDNWQGYGADSQSYNIC